MKRLIVAAAMLITSSCSASLKQAIDTSVVDTLPIVQCVLVQVGTGNLDPMAIGVACGGIAVASVIEIVETFEAYLDNGAADAGTPIVSKAALRGFLAANGH